MLFRICGVIIKEIRNPLEQSSKRIASSAYYVNDHWNCIIKAFHKFQGLSFDFRFQQWEEICVDFLFLILWKPFYVCIFAVFNCFLYWDYFHISVLRSQQSFTIAVIFFKISSRLLKGGWPIKIVKTEKNIEFLFFIFYCSITDSNQYATHRVSYAEVLNSVRI